ncbi:MAG: hypothetical protein ACRDPE_08360 [Solirubrobacterales bacterium]
MFEQSKFTSTSARRRRAARFSIAAAALVALLAIVATGAGARPAHHPKPPISAAAAFVLPPSGQCVTGGTIKVELRKIRHVGWTGAVVKVNGGRFATISPAQAGRHVSLGGLPTGTFTLSIAAKTNDHRSVSAERRYHSCATEPPKPPVTPEMPVTPKPEPPLTPPAGPIPPGAYLTNTGNVLFYVSADGIHVQDVTRGTTLSCTTGGSLNYSLAVSDIPIAADGSFGTAQEEKTIILGKPAKVTTTFNGDFNGTEANGSYRQDVAYEDGSGKTCTTNTQSWPASLTHNQGSQVLAAPQPGGYLTNTGNVLFWVSPDQAHVQDVTLGTSLSCDTGASFNYSLALTDIPVVGQSTFGTTEEESTIILGRPAKVTTTFKGHFHGLSGSGRQRAAGTYREDVAFEDGSGEKCTTGTNSWPGEVTANQGSQVLAAPQPGGYLTNTGNVLFWVSADREHVQDVTLGTSLSCDTGASLNYSLAVTDIPVEGQRTFKTTQTEDSIILGKHVTITTVFKGHFQGLSGSGRQRAAGTYRQDVAYQDGSGEKCTTGTRSWPGEVTANQGSQVLAPPQSGSYLTNTGNVLFHVSADHAHIQNVTRGTSLTCDSGTSPSSSIAIADIPIEGQTTFHTVQQESGLLGGKPVKFTVTFNGHFQGLDGNGHQRAAGTYREDVVYEDGSGTECTTGTVAWPATWSSP